MHEQEVARILFLTDDLRYTSRHRNGGNTGGTDERIDLILKEDVHELCEQNAARGAETECNNAEDENLKRLRIEEVCSGSCCTDRSAEEDRNDVHQLVLCGLVQTLCIRRFHGEGCRA